ncbi:MAG: hypothetical protein E5V52_18065, partial [Mesorhizobium sp.]
MFSFEALSSPSSIRVNDDSFHQKILAVNREYQGQSESYCCRKVSIESSRSGIEEGGIEIGDIMAEAALKFGAAETPLYREAPNNIEAEQALLGA